jgi:hypothetical protein
LIFHQEIKQVADLLWELNIIVTIILTVALLGKTVIFNAPVIGLGGINGQNHLKKGFGIFWVAL